MKAIKISGVEELAQKAETFALNRGSRSPRIAEQFINSLIL